VSRVGVARGASIIALLLATVAAVSILPIRGAAQAPQPQSRDGVAAFERIATVLQSPCCLNCHPRGDRPAQGDARHTHHPGSWTGAWPATDSAHIRISLSLEGSALPPHGAAAILLGNASFPCSSAKG
jgi:hypothetical protein